MSCENKNKILTKFVKISEHLEDTLEYYIYEIEKLFYELDESTSQNMVEDVFTLKNITYDTYDRLKNCKIKFNNHLKQSLEQNCCHLWIDDHIDDIKGECRKITYCEKCYSTKM